MAAGDASEPDVIARLSGALAAESGEPEETDPKISTKSSPSDDSDEPEAEPEAPEADEPEEKPEDEAPDTGITTIEQLAEAMGASVEDVLTTLQVQDHEGKPVKLGDVVGTYREAAKNQKLPADLERARTAYEQRQAAIDAESEKLFGEVRNQTAVLLRTLKQEEAIDWERLKLEDPGEWAVRKAEHYERLQLADQSIKMLEDQQRRATERDNQLKANWQREEAVKLRQSDPEYRDESKLQAAAMKVGSLLTQVGFDIQSDTLIRDLIGDHRVFQIVRDAANWREAQKTAKDAAKKVLKLGKSLPAGSRDDQGRFTGQKQKLDNLRKEVRKRGGDRDSVVALLRERLN